MRTENLHRPCATAYGLFYGGAPPPNWHRCPGTCKDGHPCRVWVPDPYRAGRWHRPELTPEELAAMKRASLEGQRQKVLQWLETARANLAECDPEAYPTPRQGKTALAHRKRNVRRRGSELAEVDAKLAAIPERPPCNSDGARSNTSMTGSVTAVGSPSRESDECISVIA